MVDFICFKCKSKILTKRWGRTKIEVKCACPHEADYIRTDNDYDAVKKFQIQFDCDDKAINMGKTVKPVVPLPPVTPLHVWQNRGNKEISRFEIFWNMTHIDNLSFNLQHGICSKNKYAELGYAKKQIANKKVVQIRDNKTINDRPLHDYANLYFNPRNAMLYNVLGDKGKKNILIYEIKLNINIPGIVFTDGNAARTETKWDDSKSYDLIHNKIRPILYKKYWDDDEEKRIMMAECLVPKIVPSQFISAIYICDDNHTEQKVKSILDKLKCFIPIHCQKQSNHNKSTPTFGGINRIIDEHQLFFGGKIG